MSYPSVNAPTYYSSSKDPRYPANAPVNAAPPSSAYGGYSSSQSYGHSVPAAYPSPYKGSAHTSNSSSYTTYSGGYSSHASATPRTPHAPPAQYYHHSGQAYPPPHSSSSKSYDRHGPPPSSSSKSYPASPSRPYQCDQCALSFDRSHDLKRHIDTHSGAKPYACDACGKTFSRKDALKRHQSQKQCGIDSA